MNGNVDLGTLGGNPEGLRAVRVTIPASVAGSIDSLNDSLTALAERLGCPECFSGFDCAFQIERELVISQRDEEVEIRPAVRPGAVAFGGSGVISPGASLQSGLTATLAPNVGYNLDSIKGAVKKIAELHGCPQCCSGFDITFRQELNFMVDKDVNILASSGGIIIEEA